MCTDSALPALFSPSVFGKVIKRTFPDLKYRRRRINRRINAHYEGLERVRECFDSSGHPRALPIKQEERELAERMQLEFQDKKIGGRQTKKEKRTSPHPTPHFSSSSSSSTSSSSSSSTTTTKRRRKNEPAKVKQEPRGGGGGKRRAKRAGGDDEEYLPEDEARYSDSEGEGGDSANGVVAGQQSHAHEAESAVMGSEGGPPFWREWTFPADVHSYGEGAAVPRQHDLRGGGYYRAPQDEYAPHSGSMEGTEPSFQFMSYLESGTTTSSFSSTTSSSSSSSSSSLMWRPLPTGTALPHPGMLQPPVPSFPPLQQSMTHQPHYLQTGFGSNTNRSRSSPPMSSPAQHRQQPFPPASYTPSVPLGGHPCPCPSCLPPRPSYYLPSFH
jgi:hypothetical protein